MKFLFDLLPVILFFISYKVAGTHDAAASAVLHDFLGQTVAPSQAPILIATVVVIIATFAQIGWVWIRHRRVDTMLWVSLAIVTVFGGATLLLHDPTFIKWKPTVLYWLFAGTLGFSALVLRKNLIRRMLEPQITLPDPVWNGLNGAWALFFLIMGALNLFVAYGFSEATWVNFKLFGGMGLMLVFVLLQGVFLSKHLDEESK